MSLKSLGVLFTSVFILVLTGCLNKDIPLPSFMRKEWKQTDIIIQDRIIEAIHLYDKNKVDKLSFNMNVKSFEDAFYRQILFVKPMTPQFFLEMEYELNLLYNSTDGFSPVKIDEANYLKQTITRLCLSMLSNMSLSNISYTLKVYYDELDTKEKDYDFDYKLSIVDTIVGSLSIQRDNPIPKSELELMRKNLSETGSPFKRKEIKIGLRYALKSLEKLIFLIDERLLEIDLLRKEVHTSRELFVSNDSSFKLIQTLQKVKSTEWLSNEDYPLVMGNGYVKVLPTETYRVRQYGTYTDKTYVFEEFRYRYKRTQDKWVWGSFTLIDSRMKLTVGKYVTEVEVFRITKEAYLLGSEVLLLEK